MVYFWQTHISLFNFACSQSLILLTCVRAPAATFQALSESDAHAHLVSQKHVSIRVQDLMAFVLVLLGVFLVSSAVGVVKAMSPEVNQSLGQLLMQRRPPVIFPARLSRFRFSWMHLHTLQFTCFFYVLFCFFQPGLSWMMFVSCS